MTVLPGSTAPVMNGFSDSAEASASTAIRQRPIPRGGPTSTAMPVSTFLPLARPPRSPAPPPADDRLVLLHRPGQPVPARPHQHRPQPVQHRPRGRVGADLQRPLQALRRDSVLLGGEQPTGGEPHRQRRTRAIEDRACRHRGTPMTASALIPAITEPPAPRVTAGRAGETTRPAHPVQVVQAVCISAEPGLELASRPRVMGADTRLLHTPSLLRLSKYPRQTVITPRLTRGCDAVVFTVLKPGSDSQP